MRFAYADPPYLGWGKRYYNDDTYDHIEAHAELIAGLDVYDGWAYSLQSSALARILPVCPEGIRVGAWVKPFCSFKPNVKPAYAWEPVIFHGGRKFDRTFGPMCRDWVSVSITLKKGLTGAKPFEFSFWIFEMLNMLPDDEFIDVFPGTGAVGEAWDRFRSWQMQQNDLFEMESATE